MLNLFMINPILLADLILVLHTAFIAFVVIGQALIIAGAIKGWRWVRNLWFRILHLAAIGVVVAQSWLGVLCPLTVWESDLRERAGQAGYEGSFIAHWLQKLIFYDFAPWVFVACYTAFGALVLASFILAPPRLPRLRSAGLE